MSDSDKLGLGLDEIIRIDRGSNRRGGRAGNKRGFRGRVGGRGGGQTNGFRSRGGGGLPRQSNPPAGRWKHDLFDNNSARARVGQRNTTGVNSTTKLLISNLDYGVTTSDVEELFGDVGAVRTTRVHFDENGLSLGTAEVVYERRVDAITAQQKYNGLNLDGRPMDIRLVGGVDDGSQQQLKRGSFQNGTGNENQRSGVRNNNNQQNGFRGRANRTRVGKEQQQNGTNSNGKKENFTAEDLDADLDAYRAGGTPKK